MSKKQFRWRFVFRILAALLLAGLAIATFFMLFARR